MALFATGKYFDSLIILSIFFLTRNPFALWKEYGFISLLFKMNMVTTFPQVNQGFCLSSVKGS